jgi:hypothetical protein
MAIKHLIDKSLENFKVYDLIYTQEEIMLIKNCDYLISFYEKYKDFAMVEGSTKFVNEKIYDKDDNFKCVNISLLKNANPDHKEIDIAFNFCLKSISSLAINYVQYMKKNFNKNYPPNYFELTNNIRILKYNVGENIEDHLDIGNMQRGIQNLGSCTINLNNDYEGGSFRFFSSKYKIDLGKGEGLFFPAEPTMLHGTDPVTKGSRYSLNCFLGIN